VEAVRHLHQVEEGVHIFKSKLSVLNATVNHELEREYSLCIGSLEAGEINECRRVQGDTLLNAVVLVLERGELVEEALVEFMVVAQIFVEARQANVAFEGVVGIKTTYSSRRRRISACHRGVTPNAHEIRQWVPIRQKCSECYKCRSHSPYSIHS